MICPKCQTQMKHGLTHVPNSVGTPQVKDRVIHGDIMARWQCLQCGREVLEGDKNYREPKVTHRMRFR